MSEEDRVTEAIALLQRERPRYVIVNKSPSLRKGELMLIDTQTWKEVTNKSILKIYGITSASKQIGLFPIDFSDEDE